MRIIAGQYKGRNLNAPLDDRVRPTTGKVREAIFAILTNDIYDSVVIDLFAGTGGLGLEALSRGARKCYFCDNSRDSLKLIRENIKVCKAEDKSIVLAGGYEKNISLIKEKCDILLLDPPYKDGLYKDVIKMAIENNILKDDAVIVCEHSITDSLPESISGVNLVKTKKYGQIGVSIYR